MRMTTAGASSFTEAAGALALWGRFVKPMLPICADSLPAQTPDPLRSLRYLQTLDTRRASPPRLLPERMVEVIHDFPELRQARVPTLPVGLNASLPHRPILHPSTPRRPSMLTFVPIAFTVFLCFFLVLVTCVVLLFAAALRLLGQGVHLHAQSRPSQRRLAD